MDYSMLAKIMQDCIRITAYYVQTKQTDVLLEL